MAKQPTIRFLIDELAIELPRALTTPLMRERLEAGLYEGPERQLTRSMVQPGDRVLDLGAGAGLVAMVAARITGAANVTSVEANPAMHPVIRRNFRHNELDDIRLIKGAVMGRAYQGDSLTFHVHPGFWSASIHRNHKIAAEEVTVPVKRFPALVRGRDASVVLMDIEGAEQGIMTEKIPASVRLLIVEMHPNVYGKETSAALIDAVVAQGFVISARVKGDTVVAFSRQVETKKGGADRAAP